MRVSFGSLVKVTACPLLFRTYPIDELHCQVAPDATEEIVIKNAANKNRISLFLVGSQNGLSLPAVRRQYTRVVFEATLTPSGQIRNH